MYIKGWSSHIYITRTHRIVSAYNIIDKKLTNSQITIKRRKKIISQIKGEYMIFETKKMRVYDKFLCKKYLIAFSASQLLWSCDFGSLVFNWADWIPQLSQSSPSVTTSSNFWHRNLCGSCEIDLTLNQVILTLSLVMLALMTWQKPSHIRNFN